MTSFRGLCPTPVDPPLINLKNRFHLSAGREDPGVKSIEEPFKTSPFYREVMERVSLIRRASFSWPFNRKQKEEESSLYTLEL
ncbi:hypothetical protein CDAR_286041 [Caerostris darwini]|uniref:Uncharacterized protein n=1 Tax=Caerostris darwini TaxID=1538125 RepID=A0AAV4N270_9ARAC|nr:hypothetical protein CDAR_286041 [Caerostris darwini]